MIERHNMILDLITKYKIDTQEDLAQRLKQAGYEVTQATVSRDIKKLQLVKRVDAEGSRYVSSATGHQDDTMSQRMLNIFASSVMSIDYAENLVVIKTMPGMAQAAAAAIDALGLVGVLGTIAGDDTIMVIARDIDRARFTAARFEKMR